MLSSHALCWVLDLGTWWVRSLGLLAPLRDIPTIHPAVPVPSLVSAAGAGKIHVLSSQSGGAGTDLSSLVARNRTWDCPVQELNSVIPVGPLHHFVILSLHFHEGRTGKQQALGIFKTVGCILRPLCT